MKRLCTSGTPVASPLVVLPAPPELDANGADEEAAAYEVAVQEFWAARRQFMEDVQIDFAAFDSSIIRMQMLLTSNAKERERYAAEKLRIEASAQAVRENTTELRAQLEEAQKTLTLRKTYDELAEKITSNRLLRPREDQTANLEKLHAEIADLEIESSEYAQTWTERRQQFGRIIEEGMQLRRLIRDEKEEVERREGMEDREEREDGEDVEIASLRGRSSGVATPRHDGGGATPLHPGMDEDSTSTGLTVNRRLNTRAKSPLRASTPVPEADTQMTEESEDTNMAEDGEVCVEMDAAGDTTERLEADEREDSMKIGSAGNTTTADRMDVS